MSNKVDTTDMKQETNRELKPRLRFPEFRDAPEWEEKKLEEVFDFHSTANNSRADLSSEDDTFYIHYGDIHTKFHSYVDFSKDTVPKIASTLYRNAAFLENGDLIVADASEDAEGIAKAVEVRGLDDGVKAISGLHTILLRDSQKQYVEGFRGLLREIDRVKKQVQMLAVGVKVYAVSKTVLKQILLPLPSPQEQQKIADCLTSLDDLIAAQSQKLDSLKAHKKGLMQQLFPAEGETMPRLRFPEFQNAPEWEVKKLKDISSSIFDGTHQTPTYTTEGVPFYSVENIVSGNKNKFISREDYIVATSKNKPEKGDVLLTRIGKIGYSQVATWDHDFSVYVTLAVIKQSKLFDSHYMHYFMQSNRYQAELLKKSLSNAVPPKINMDSLRNTEILLPVPSEQQKIADCLASIDELIAAQTQKLDMLKAHKKGLMQQLFPASNEVQG